jgi:hypothetical protein
VETVTPDAHHSSVKLDLRGCRVLADRDRIFSVPGSIWRPPRASRPGGTLGATHIVFPHGRARTWYGLPDQPRSYLVSLCAPRLVTRETQRHQKCTFGPHSGPRRFDVSIVDDLVSSLVERNAIRLNGTFAVTLVDGGVSLKGQVISTIRDQKKNKDVLNVKAPITAHVKIAEIVIPLPQIR